jgi:lipopolysaccharide transport system permease protein
MSGPSGPLRRVWRYRELLHSLVVRNLKVKYQRSLLGFVWTLVNPLLTVGILVVVFSHVVRIPLPHYWAFLLSGYFVWNFVLQTLNTGTYIFAEHSRLTRSVAFPSEILVFGAAGSRLIEFVAEIVLVLIALVLLHHGRVPESFMLLPVLAMIQLLLVVGLALPIATLSVFYYDVQHALPIALTTLFYLSPVFYPAELVPAAARPYFMLNPIAGLLTLYQDVIYRGQFPALPLLAQTLGASLLLYLLGYAIFRRYAVVFAEVV